MGDEALLLRAAPTADLLDRLTRVRAIGPLPFDWRNDPDVGDRVVKIVNERRTR